MLAILASMGYNVLRTKPPEVFDHPVFLNLHHFKRNSNIFEPMSGLLKQSVEGRSSFEGIHLAIARSQKTGTGTLGTHLKAACSSDRAAGPERGSAAYVVHRANLFARCPNSVILFSFFVSFLFPESVVY